MYNVHLWDLSSSSTAGAFLSGHAAWYASGHAFQNRSDLLVVLLMTDHESNRKPAATIRPDLIGALRDSGGAGQRVHSVITGEASTVSGVGEEYKQATKLALADQSRRRQFADLP